MNEPRHLAETQLSLSVALVKKLLSLMVVLVAALVFSILIEWIGLVFWWPEQGIGHSAAMVETERQYLSSITASTDRLFDSAPLIAGILVVLESLPRRLGLTSLVGMLDTVALALESAINMTKVFVLRLLVMVLSTPTFLIFALVGLTRGLVGRELRRWGGGRESSGMYHLYFRLLPEALIGLWFIYLSMPVSVNPFYVIGPAALLFAMLVASTAYRLKKYL